MPNLGGWEFVILIGVLVLLFGAKKLPDMARSIGMSARVFKGEMKGLKSDDAAKPAEPPAAAAPAPAPAPAAELPPVQPVTPAAPAPTVAQEPSPAAGQGPTSSTAK
jgi:sec-independent protein translocase protein TatA